MVELPSTMRDNFIQLRTPDQSDFPLQRLSPLTDSLPIPVDQIYMPPIVLPRNLCQDFNQIEVDPFINHVVPCEPFETVQNLLATDTDSIERLPQTEDNHPR